MLKTTLAIVAASAILATGALAHRGDPVQGVWISNGVEPKSITIVRTTVRPKGGKIVVADRIMPGDDDDWGCRTCGLSNGVDANGYKWNGLRWNGYRWNGVTAQGQTLSNSQGGTLIARGGKLVLIPAK